MNVAYNEDDGRIAANMEMSGTLHEFYFTVFQGEAWPERMIQGGEEYRIGVTAVPDQLVEYIEEEYGLEVTEG